MGMRDNYLVKLRLWIFSFLQGIFSLRINYFIFSFGKDDINMGGSLTYLFFIIYFFREKFEFILKITQR